MTNKQVVEKFYEAFSRRNAAIMNSCYAEDIVYSNPVYGLLQGQEVHCMWELFCKEVHHFSLTFGTITEIDEEYITCNWTAKYNDIVTGRQIIKKAKAFMRINKGIIVEHSDAFNINTWMTQHFGWKGYLFGWTYYMKRSVFKKARKRLKTYMNNR